MRDLEIRKEIENIILKKNIDKNVKEKMIKWIYKDEESIPIMAILNELNFLEVKFLESEKKFLQDVFSKYGW